MSGESLPGTTTDDPRQQSAYLSVVPALKGLVGELDVGDVQ